MMVILAASLFSISRITIWWWQWYAANNNDNADYNAYAELLLMWMKRKPTWGRRCLCEPLATSVDDVDDNDDGDDNDEGDNDDDDEFVEMLIDEED